MNFNNLSRTAAEMTVSHLVCLPCPQTSRIALSVVCVDASSKKTSLMCFQCHGSIGVNHEGYDSLGRSDTVSATDISERDQN
jgi:hypothetical protein